MADIRLTVVPPNTFIITLDWWEWTGLKVNGVSIPTFGGSKKANIQFQYEGQGPLTWEATANQNINLVNPGNIMIMAGPTQNHSYIAIVSYEALTDGVTLKGHLGAYGYMPGSLPGPLLFSQGRMTGTFRIAS